MDNICTEDVVKMFETHDKVLEALANRRFVVLLYKGYKFYLFKGVRKDYIVSPCSFCTCEDFIINYIAKSRKTPCYHVVGFRIAELYNKLTEVEIDPHILAKVLDEVILDGISTTLRKILR